jgi:hypothetical protein
VLNTTERKGSEITKETNVNIHINKDSSLVLFKFILSQKAENDKYCKDLELFI